jgi:uncharacterized protein YjbJ (UPF0337 family)
MNEDILQGKWKQIRGDAKRLWGKLTDDDLVQLEGHADKLNGILQEKYGYSQKESEDEVARFRREMTNKYGANS